MILGSPNEAEIEKKRSKIDVEKQYFFGLDVSSNFRRLGLRKCIQNRLFFSIFSETSFLQKSWFSLGKIANFEVSSLKNSTKNRCKNASENNVEKNDSKIEFGHRFLASQNVQNRSAKRRKTEPVSRRYARRPQVGGN